MLGEEDGRRVIKVVKRIKKINKKPVLSEKSVGYRGPEKIKFYVCRRRGSHGLIQINVSFEKHLTRDA